MPGRQLNLLFIFIALVITGCGRSSKGAPQFLPGHILDKGDGSELSIERRMTRTWKDYDGDGIPDRLDPDIDDDGVPNLADQYPFDGSRWGEDKDNDGIADFIDFSFAESEVYRALAPLQNELKEKFNVVLINGPLPFTVEQIQNIYLVLNHKEINTRLSFDKLSTIVHYSEKEQNGLARADYDEAWETISFYPAPEIRADMSSFRGTLVHELGHVHAAENPDEFKAFSDAYSDWDSPSEYGKSSVEEGYAEEFAYQVFLQGIIEINPDRFQKSEL